MLKTKRIAPLQSMAHTWLEFQKCRHPWVTGGIITERQVTGSLLCRAGFWLPRPYLISLMSVPDSKVSKLPALLKEPLVHFLAAAALLTVGYHFLARPEVTVSPQLLGGLRKEYEGAIGRQATPAEMTKLANEYLESEILYREALRNDMVKDNRVRGMLIQTMRTSLRPIVREPAEADLETLRQETPEIYRYPAKVGFEHVSFPNADAAPPDLLEKLRAGASPQGLGDGQMKLANPLPPTFRPQLEHLFGTEFTATLTGCKEGTWEGPFTSTRGVHFVRVLTQEPEHDMPMSELRPTLIAKWTSRQESRIISEKVAELRDSYRVNMPKVQ